jgi:ubiquinone/menaquinone biosynthesis C-methylase UbiE
MGGLVFDQALADRLESAYRTRDILRRRRLVREALDASPGERILDIGCGPGFYTEELLAEVGERGVIVGVDNSPQMLSVAAHRVEGHANVTFHEADATSLPVEDGSFDVALCVQVFEYVPDVDRALAEMHRVVRPGGRVVVWDVDWTTVSWHSTDAAAMERALQAWDEHLAHPALPRTLAGRLRSAGFEDVAAEGHVFATTELVPEAYVGAIFPLFEEFVAERGSAADAKVWADDQRALDARGEFFFSCTQFCFTAKLPTGPTRA